MDTAELRQKLMERREELERQRAAITATSVYADLNAVMGAIQQCDWELALIGDGDEMPDPDDVEVVDEGA